MKNRFYYFSSDVFTKTKKDKKNKQNNPDTVQKKNTNKNKKSLKLYLHNPIDEAKNDREITKSPDLDTNSDHETVLVDKQIIQKISHLSDEIDDTLNTLKAQYCNHAYSIHQSSKTFMNFCEEVKKDYSTYMSDYDVVKSILDEWETMDNTIKDQYNYGISIQLQNFVFPEERNYPQ